MTKRGKGISYNRASAGSGRGISAGQWNGFLELHKDFYNGVTDQDKLPPLLRNSTVALAVLKEGSDPIDAYKPVRIIKNLNMTDLVNGVPSYEVEAVDATDENGKPTQRHGNYAFTLGEGCSEEGGRIIVSGLALVSVTRSELDGEDVRTYAEDWDSKWAFGGYQGDYDSSYYVVNDGTICALRESEAFILAPIGHFKVVSWYDPSDSDKQLDRDDSTAFLLIDMAKKSGMATAVCFDGCPSGYNPPSSDIDYSGDLLIDKINLVPALCILYTGMDTPHDPLPSSYQQLSGDYDGSEVAEVVLQRRNWDFPAVFVNTSSRGIPSGLVRLQYDAAINRLVPVDAHPASVNETSAYVQYSDVDGQPTRMGAALDVPQVGSNPTVEDFYYNSSKTLSMYLNGDGADYETSARGLVAFANNDFLEASLWNGELNSKEYSSRYGGVNLSRNVVRAWVLMLHEDHTHATVSNSLGGQRMDGALCSCGWGAYKIINIHQLKSGSGGSSYPQWVEADLIVVDPPRTKSLEIVYGTARTPDLYDNSRGLEVFTGSETYPRYTQCNTRFPEIISDSDYTYARRNFVDNYPQAVYSGVLHYNVELKAATSDPEEDLEFTDPEGNASGANINPTLVLHDGATAEISVYGAEGDGTETRIGSSTLKMQNGVCKRTTGTTIERPASVVSGTVPFIWAEKYEKIDFRLEWDDSSCFDAYWVKGNVGDIQGMGTPRGTAHVELNRLGSTDYDYDPNLIAAATAANSGQGSSTNFYTQTPPAYPTLPDGKEDKASGGGYRGVVS